MILAAVLLFGLVLARVAAFVAFMPLFGGRNVPRSVKAGFATALAGFWVGSVDLGKLPVLSDPSLQAVWLPFGLTLLREAFLGALLGYGFGLVLVPARVAGEFLTQQMGLAVATVLNPTAETPNGSIAQFFEALAILLFLGLDGHHLFLAALHSTFTLYPIGGPGTPLPVLQVIQGTALAEQWGLLLAAPLGACLFLTSIVLALMARAAPQLNIHSVGFTMQVIVALIATFLLLPEMGALMTSIFGHFSTYLQQLVTG